MPDAGQDCEIKAGDVMCISRDVLVNGVRLFSQGETVVIAKIDPHPEHPGHRFVVFSGLTSDYYQLTREDFKELPPIPQETPEAGSGKVMQWDRPLAVALLATSFIMLVAAFTPFYITQFGQPAWGAIQIFFASVSGVIVGFRAFEALGLYKRLPEKKYTRVWAVAVSFVAVAASIFLVSPHSMYYHPTVGAYLYLIGAILSLVVSAMLWGAPRYAREVRKCPYCAKFVKREAVKCRWCNSDLPVADRAATPQ